MKQEQYPILITDDFDKIGTDRYSTVFLLTVTFDIRQYTTN